MNNYVAYVNDYNIIENHDFKALFKAVVEDGIEHVRETGFSRVLKIYNEKTGQKVCSVFFNQRRGQYGTDVSSVRVHRCDIDKGLWTKEVRTFTF